MDLNIGNRKSIRLIIALFLVGTVAVFINSNLLMPILVIFVYLIVLWASFRNKSIVKNEIEKTSTFYLKLAIGFLIVGVVSGFAISLISFKLDEDLKFAKNTFTITIFLLPYSLLFIRLCFRELIKRKNK